MESSIRKITSFLKDGSSHATEVLTIWGMPGIGKTHLADYIFKLHYHDFDRSCFLKDIERKCAAPNGVLDLQKQLLKDIQYGPWMEIIDTDVGTCKIEEALRSKQTLLVLDGINKFEQLDVLIGTNNLHPGSRIIITSKSEFLTEKCGLFQRIVIPLIMHTKLLLEVLDEKESLQLLSWHAFGYDKPKEDIRKESIKVVEYCKGYLLALEVLGSSIRNGDATWEDILESLGKEINPDILKVMKISFDSLPYETDKELFKHITCFFVGEDRKFTEDILKACGICKSSGVKILINRCLLKVGSSNKLEMHQLLQDMGRDIVRQEHPDKPWKRSRLWHREECLDVLINKKGTAKIQGLVLDMRTESSCSSSSSNKRKYEDAFSVYLQKSFEAHTFSKMCNLRLLQLNYVQLEGSYKNFPPRLVWLCMHGFPLRCIPLHIRMENMVALDLSNSNLQKLWEEPKLLRSLKFLNLSSCLKLVSVGDFSWFPALERLILARCKRLNELCESIGNHCHQLEVLDLSGCIELKELPQTIGKLKNLTELSINGCSNLSKFPIDMTGMESLKVLKANDVNVASSSAIVPAIPRSLKISAISLPVSLVRLSLRNNNLSNESFPKDFSSLSMLKELILADNPIVSLPDCVRSLRSLERLNLDGCRSLKTVLLAPDTLQVMRIHNCYSVEKITFYPEKSAPPQIAYIDASTLIEIQDKFKLQVLSEIDVEMLRSLGWISIEPLRHYKISMGDCNGCYHYTGKIIPTQMLYEHGIFSTYLQGQEVPKWFTYRSNNSSFILQSSPKNRRICGLNVCIVNKISSNNSSFILQSSPKNRRICGLNVGPSSIEIRNLTKNCSWTYVPLVFIHPQDYGDEYGDVYVVWLNHWMFGNNEFEDGDEVSIHFSVKFCREKNWIVCEEYVNVEHIICYDSEEPDFANVTEYGINLVYEDENKREDPLAYYKSWKHIIGGDLSAAELSSGHYLLKHWSD